jgi:tetratricopeptide (TPR) repeat protein
VALSLGGQPAAAAFEEAIRLDPLLFEARYFYARDCFARGDRERAASEFEAAMRSRPEDYQAPLLVAQTYDDLGRAKDAIEARRRGVALAEERLRMAPDDSRALYMGANGLVALGRIEEGLLWADRAAALDPTDPMVLYNIACIKAMAGVVEPALDCLERAIGGGLNQRGWVEHDNNLDNLRGHPRFAEIIRKLA